LIGEAAPAANTWIQFVDRRRERAQLGRERARLRPDVARERARDLEVVPGPLDRAIERRR